ncbi:hypothetical protein BJP40_06570 [Streptomyces sp. CC53]|uniref:hypothetical protein n=1 Tax=Streptomyces sp. CC53 TaxID=1906740 RepID=UPI0008DE3443|nr:hypothetical protein [Streptomyces sp. CC53]OII61186.1 hypothetical protein BJP40_06570 [Streptomyces sp. CC53]
MTTRPCYCQENDGYLAVPDTGAYLIIDGAVRQVTSRWGELGPTTDGRIRWGLVTQDEHDAQGGEFR